MQLIIFFLRIDHSIIDSVTYFSYIYTPYGWLLHVVFLSINAAMTYYNIAFPIHMFRVPFSRKLTTTIVSKSVM